MKRTSSTRREALLTIFGASTMVPVLPKAWSKPVINSLITPTHAQTSCSNFTTTAVNESLTLTVTATEVQGPIVVTRGASATFSGNSVSRIDECRGGQDLNIEITFSGVIDSANNRITGELNIVQLCGTELVCEQIATFSVTQDPIDNGSDLGDYSGTLIGTQSCCDDFE